jgi:hypothetical protein
MGRLGVKTFQIKGKYTTHVRLLAGVNTFQIKGNYTVERVVGYQSIKKFDSCQALFYSPRYLFLIEEPNTPAQCIFNRVF